MNRHYALLLCLFLTSFSLVGQIEKGDRMLSYMDNNLITVGNFFPGLASEHLQLLVNPKDAAGLFLTGVDYRFALSNRFLVGSGLGLLASLFQGENNYNVIFIQPSVRYYLPRVNSSGFFAEGSAALGFYSSEDVPTSFAGALGHQWTVAPGVLLTASAQYNINDDLNEARLGLNLDFLLNAKNKGEKPPAAFEKGDLLIGTDLMGITINQFTIGVGLRPVVYKFLNAETALGVGVKIGYQYTRRQTRLNDFRIKSGNLGLDLRLRRYLGATNRLRPFAEISAGVDGNFISGEDRSGLATGFGSKEENLEGAFGLAAGAQLFIRENFAFEFGPGVRYFTGETEGTGFVTLNAGVRWRWRR